MLAFLHRWGFSLAVAVSLTAHGALALYGIQEGDAPARVAPFRIGRTTVALRPTVDVVTKEHLPVDESMPPAIEPTELTSAASLPHLITPRLVLDRPEIPASMAPQPPAAPEALDRPADKPVVEAAKLPPKRKRVPAADLAEFAQPLASQARSGADRNAVVDVNALPRPPYPPHLPYQPRKFPFSFVLGSDGRFRQVKVETGNERSNKLIADFIERHWWGTPERRGGQAVPLRVKENTLEFD